MLNTYPQMIVTLTDGDKTSEVKFNGVLSSFEEDDSDVILLGEKLGEAKGGLTYVNTALVQSSVIASAS